MRKIIHIIFLIVSIVISFNVLALPIITVIHKASPYQNQVGYLKVKLGAFRMCAFQDSAPIKAGSTFVIDLNDIAKYPQIGTHCTQKKLAHMLKGPTSFIVSVYYPSIKFHSACQTKLIKGRDQKVTSVVAEYLPPNFFRSKGLLSCGFVAVKAVKNH